MRFSFATGEKSDIHTLKSMSFFTSLKYSYFFTREREWAESMKMGAYLSVARGTEVPPKFVEVEYKGGKDGDAPFALVGKGITFDRCAFSAYIELKLVLCS